MRVSGIAQAVAIFAAGFLLFCGFWLAAFWIAQIAGFNVQTTPEYGFSSGIGPMILTAMSMATIITGLWHGHNCHESGCFRLGRHRVNGTPWCNVHHENARSETTDSDRLDRIIELLERQ